MSKEATEKKGTWPHMNRKTFPTLIQSLETLTQEDHFLAPELSTLIALDASLFAAINLLEFQNPCCANFYNRPRRVGIEEHIADSICILANALRKNLSAYSAAMRQTEEEESTDQQDVRF
jgi:hypothetical protein